MRSADITFVVLTRNEAINIADCLRSIPEGSSKLVFDAQSTDDTATIAASLGARVEVHAWKGFIAARKAASALVRTPWTFMLDADERVTPELQRELLALDPAEETVAYSLPRRNWFCGRWIRGAGWWPDRLIRLFRTGRVQLVAHDTGAAGVHERWEPSGKSATLNNPLEHFSYPSLADYRRKFAAYTTLEAQAARPSLARVLTSWTLVPMRMMWLSFGRGGVLDGWRGLYVSGGSALYPAVAAYKSYRRRS